MKRSRPITYLIGAAALGLIALAAAGCGGNSSKPQAASAAPAAASGNGAATVDTANTGALGTILVDSNGRTLYLFEKDSGTTSACSGTCADYWPPLRTAKPTSADGLDASLIGTTMRSDGSPQVTYNGHPLYLYSGDQAAGDTNGQGLTDFGGSWDALTPAGDQVSDQPSSPVSSGSSSVGGGY
jgi:predicted lipoprotein with Yx(FWY)xxD motif